jgi:hypothetical protein
LENNALSNIKTLLEELHYNVLKIMHHRILEHYWGTMSYNVLKFNELCKIRTLFLIMNYNSWEFNEFLTKITLFTKNAL